MIADIYECLSENRQKSINYKRPASCNIPLAYDSQISKILMLVGWSPLFLILIYLLLLLLLLLLSTFVERTFTGCHKCAKEAATR